MTQKNAWVSLFGYRERENGVNAQGVSEVSDFTRKPLCECGEEFLDWVEETFPTLAEDITARQLDEVILVITKEYAHRAQSVSAHRLNHCLQDVFEELLEALTAKQWELHRTDNVSVIKGRVLGEESTRALYIGEEIEEG